MYVGLVSDPSASNAEERRLARKALPYLRASGWIDSHRTSTAVDADYEPIPWYRYAAIDFIAARTQPTWNVFEFGSGNSTLWWAQRVRSVTAVEHDDNWAERLAASAPDNVKLLHVSLEPGGAYCRTPQRTGSRFQVVLVDGRDRVNCALQSLTCLTEDGVIIWDDSHRRRYAVGLAELQQRGFRRVEYGSRSY